MFLTPADLVELTGYTQPARQAAHLDRQGIRYSRRCDGQIRVTWAQVNNPTSEPPANQPNLEAARG